MTTVIVALALTAVFASVLAGLVHSQDRYNARVQRRYEAHLRAWRIQQAEYETEQRLRAVTRQAMNDMIAETRRHADSPNTDV